MSKINYLNTESLQLDEQEQLIELENLVGKEALTVIPYDLIKQRAMLSASLSQFESMYHYDSEKPLRFSDGSLAVSFDYDNKQSIINIMIKGLQQELHSVTSNILFILQEEGYEF